MNDDDVRYVAAGDEFEDDESQYNVMAKKAIEGKTDLQEAALAATGRTRFKDKPEREAFKKWEAYALGADDESLVWQAWIKNRIEIAGVLNVKQIVFTMPNLIKAIANEDKRSIWFTDNRAKVLKKIKAATLKQVTGVDDMELAMERARAKRKGSNAQPE